MRPLKLRLSGLRSWRHEQELMFRDVDLAAIVGPTGSGKSSILEAIVYALYNATTYDAREVRTLISSDESTVSVAFDFEADGDEWRVTRSTSRGSYPPSVHKLTCLTDPECHPIVEGRTAVNDAVERLLGLDFDQFTSAVLLPQGRFQRLLTATDGERTGILKGVFRLDELAVTRELADGLRRDVAPALESVLDERSTLLPDPESERDTARALVTDAEQIVVTLQGCVARYEQHREQARQHGDASDAAERSAQNLDESLGLVPSLEDAIAAAEELSEREGTLLHARNTATDDRDRARAAIRVAEEGGTSVAALSAACQFLTGAADALPRHNARAEALSEERERLAAAETQLAREKQELENDRKRLNELRSDLTELNRKRDGALERLRAAGALLMSVRSAISDVEGTAQAIVDADEQVADAELAAADAETVADRTRLALVGAEEALEALRRSHAAAHLGMSLAPGQSCPVCHSTVAADFAPDEPPGELAGAEATVRIQREASDKAQRDAVAARTRVDDQQAAVAELHNKCRRLSDRAAAVLVELGAGGIEGNLSADDKELLASHAADATGAEDAARAAADDVAGLAAEVGAADSGLTRRMNELASNHQSIETQASTLRLDGAATVAEIQRLPAVLRPAAISEEGLVRARDAATRTLTEAKLLVADEQRAAELRDELGRELETLEQERSRRVHTPRRDALSQGEELVLQMRMLEKPPALANRPSDGDELAHQAEWLDTVCSGARAAATALRAAAISLQSLREAAERATAAALADGSAALGEELENAAALGNSLNDHRVRQREAIRRVKRAEEELPKVTALAQRIDALRRKRAALEEVCRLLNDSQFIGWLVARRQRHLLVVASEILAGMTEQRYRFAANFTVIDGRSGLPRSAKTLSGGESFLASLALALGMAELAARNGGRIGSLYLDEGFGSLDPNALDEAIEALETRARAGQMIMVISHVPAVAERIERVLQVTPSPGGSTAEWLDDTDREGLLVSDVAD